jgi:hypothetical protein
VNDVKALLALALDDGHGPAAPDEMADPGADLARGRALLRRRRLLGAGGVAAAMAIGAIVPLALQSGATPASHSLAGVAAHQKSHSVQSHHAKAAAPLPVSSPSALESPPSSLSPAGHVALVAWTGTQPPGYEVNWMPKDWVVQGSNPYALTIAPPNDRDTDSNSFLRKLVVMLQSASVTSQPAGVSQPVNGRPGFFEPASQAGGNTNVLTFKVADGQWVVVQAPTSLGWNSAQLAKFAGGVTVLAAARQGVG